MEEEDSTVETVEELQYVSMVAKSTIVGTAMARVSVNTGVTSTSALCVNHNFSSNLAEKIISLSK